MENQQQVSMKNVLKKPFLMALAGVLIMTAALFLPYAASNEEHKEFLEEYASEAYSSGLNMSNESLINVSLVEFIKVHIEMLKVERSKLIAIGVLVLIGVSVLLLLLTFLFITKKRPIAAFIFNGLNVGVFWLLGWDFKDRGVIPGSNYNHGIAYPLFYIGAIIVLVASIWMLAAKIKFNRQKKIEAN